MQRLDEEFAEPISANAYGEKTTSVPDLPLTIRTVT